MDKIKIILLVLIVFFVAITLRVVFAQRKPKLRSSKVPNIEL